MLEDGNDGSTDRAAGLWGLLLTATLLGVVGAVSGIVFLAISGLGESWYGETGNGWFDGHWWWIAVSVSAGVIVVVLRKWLDLSSVGALAVGGYHLGITKGDLEAAAAMKGVDEDPFDDDDESVNLRGEGDVDYLEGDTDDFDDDDDDDDDLEGDRDYAGDDDDDDDDIDDEYYEEAAA